VTGRLSLRAAPILYALFFLSGAAGLFYESVWSRYLGLFVGHDAYAQVVVLAIFLGGMSIGAALVARRAERIANPLLGYAIMEGLAGLIGLLFHDVFGSVTEFAYTSMLPTLANGPLRTAAVWSVAALLILPQSILLGTTFPLMSAGVMRAARGAPGHVLGWLYFTNSLGAAIGVLVAGFVLVERIGLPGVLIAAATINLLVGVVAFLLSRRVESAAVAPIADFGASRASLGDTRLLLWAAGLTAFASFCYEINWIRMLSLVLGSATHSFELMLSAFILGLALGAFWIRRRSDGDGDPLVALGKIQIAMGLLAVATLPLYAVSFRAMEVLLTSVSRTGSGYLVFSVARYALCLAVMLPATFCAGMTLPLLTRALIRRGEGEASIGRVYAVNTLGSIIGVIVASLVLLPLLGLKTLAIVAGVIDIGIGIALLRSTIERPRAVRWAVLAVGIAVLIGMATPLDRTILTAGVFRGNRLSTARSATLPFYADGRTATVSMSESGGGFLVLATNGKADASLDSLSRAACTSTTVRRRVSGDQVTQLLMGIIPLAYHPGGGSAAVIGLGSGVSSHVLLGSPALQRVVTVEIEPQMIAAARLFRPANARTYDDPRSELVVDDAKAYFAASGTKWEMIISEPSNPWVSGVSGLFTVEFYRRIRSQLAPGGIFAQWLQTYELDDDLVLSVIAALHEVFPDYEVHQVGGGDLLLVASADGALPAPDWSAVLAMPGIRDDLCRYLPITPATLEATHLADRGLLGPAVTAIGTPNSDYYPVLDLRAERRRFEGRTAGGALALGDDWFNLARALRREPALPVEVDSITLHGMRRELQQWSRTWQEHPGPVPDDLPPFVIQSRFDVVRWKALLAQNVVPEDWRPWLGQLNVVARARHAGTAGWLDAALFDEASRFAERHGAPAEARAVIAFRRAVQGWDDVAALEAASVLVGGGVATSDWIDGDELRDGALVAALRTGRAELVAQWDLLTAKLARRGVNDLRSRLLAGWVQGVGK
jgi:predicted membrane-bound spermidine synthase